VSDADCLLCAPIEAARYDVDGCVADDPVAWNIPRFIEFAACAPLRAAE
jgi:hypothetical protein